MDSDRRAARSFLAVAAAVGIALALQVEWVESAREWFPLFCSIGVALGAAAWFYSKSSLPPEEAVPAPAALAPPARWYRPLLVVSVLVLATGLVLLYRDLRSIAGGWLWLAGILAVLAGTLLAERPAGESGPGPGSRWRPSRTALLTAALFAFALWLRLYRLDEIPAELVDDEALIGEWGMRALRGEPLWDGATATRTTLFRKGGAAEPMLGCVFHALVMMVAGEDTFGVRLAASLAGAAGVVLLYLLLREFLRPGASMAAAFLLAVCHTHLYWTRSGMLQSLVTLAATGVILLVLRGLRANRWLPWLAAGALLGLAQHLYEGGRFLVLVVAPFFVWQAVAERGFLRRHGLHVLAMAGMSAAVFAPLAVWYLEHPETLMAITHGAYVFELPEYLESRYPGLGTAGIILGQLERSLSGFAVRGDLGTFYPILAPLFDPVVRSLVLAGIAGFTLTLRPAFLLVSLWLWVPVLIACSVTTDPPPMSRLMMSVPALYAVAAAVLDRLGRLAECGYGNEGRTLAAALAGLLLVASGLWNLDVFFVQYPTSFPINLQTAAAHAAAAAGDGYKAYFLGPPFLSSSAPTVRFIGKGVRREDLEPGELPVQERGRRGGLFVVVPEQPEVLARLQEIYPGGALEEHFKASGEPFFTTYRVERDLLDAALAPEAPWVLPELRFGRSGKDAGEIGDGRALAADGEGRVYVADAGNRRVAVFADDDGRGLGEVDAPSSGKGAVGLPWTVALEPDGDLLILDRERHRIQRLTPDGKPAGVIGARNQLTDPLSFALAPDGGVVVLDGEPPSLVRFSAEGRDLARSGSAGSGPGQFDRPAAVAVDEEGRVYVADLGNARVQRFSPDLAFELEWPVPVATQDPSQMIAAGGGVVYLAAGEAGQVLRYSPDGEPLWGLGSKGEPPHHLSWPVAVSLDAQGRVWVLDADRASVYRFDPGPRD